MSLNSILEQKYLPKVQALLSILETQLGRWRGAATEERKLVIEAQILDTFQRLLESDVNFNLVRAGDHPEIFELMSVYGDYQYLVALLNAKLTTLAEMFLKHFNTQQLMMVELVGQMKRIRQKKAMLEFWNQSLAKYVLVQHFLTFDELSSNRTTATECYIDTAQGIMTLPVRKRTTLIPSNARIGAGSNGMSGNSDLLVQTNNYQPLFAINGDPNNWFEYERLDAGPALLTFTIEFKQPQIINQLEIEAVNPGQSLPVEIEDILFTTSTNQQVSIHELTSGDLNKDFFTLKSTGNDIAWKITFLPVQTGSISIKLRQNESYLITQANNVKRNRFAIGLKRVTAYMVEYETTGGINSTLLDLPTGLYVVDPVLNILPTNPTLYNLVLELSFDDGNTWQRFATLADRSYIPLLLAGNNQSCVWRLTIERNNSAFANVTSFFEDVNGDLKTKSVLRTLSRMQSPASFALSEKPGNGVVTVIQPKIARRGDRFKGIILGKGGGQAIAFPMPFDFLDSALELDAIHVYVARREYTYNDDASTLAADEWAFSEDYKEILFTDDLPANSEIRLVLDEELMHFEERSDGFYHEAELMFDPDENNIAISFLGRKTERVNKLIPRESTIVNLGHKYLAGAFGTGDFSLTSKLGDTWSEVANKTTVLATGAGGEEFFVDYVNGVLYLSHASEADALRASFKHLTPQTLATDQFDVVFKDNLPWGFKVHKNAFEAEEVTDTVGSGTRHRVQTLSGEWATRYDHHSGSDNAVTLSQTGVVKGTLVVDGTILGSSLKPVEVPFIDGATEFLGIMSMNNEYTVELTEGGVGETVSFTLNAGGLYYSDFGLVTSDSTVFNVVDIALDDLGDYYIDAYGVVTVNVGPSGVLPAGIELSYFYKDPSFEPVNKYSVDYVNGILYSYTQLQASSTIRYKAAKYRVAYDVASVISEASFNSKSNVVSVRTEGLNEVNSLVKVIWTEATTKNQITQLKDYFTPLLNILAFRFR